MLEADQQPAQGAAPDASPPPPPAPPAKRHAPLMRFLPLLAAGLGLLLAGCGTSNVTFGAQAVGAETSQTFQVSGFTAQSVEITLSDFQVTGDQAAFSQTNNCDNQVVPPNGSCTVTVYFKPTQPGPTSATVSFYADYTPVGFSKPIEEDQDTANLSGIGLGPTTTSVVCAPASLLIGQNATCTATVRDVLASDTYTPSGTVTFSSDNPTASFSGGGTCTLAAATPGATQASCGVVYTPTGASRDGQADTIAARFAPASGDYHTPSASSGTQDGTVVVHMQPTTLVYGGATSGDYQDPAPLSATLTATDTGAPVPGQTVAFSVGAESCSGLTNQQGVAGCSVTPLDAPAGSPYPITAAFAGGNGYAASSDDSASFTVTREQATASYTGPATAVRGEPATLTGTLLADGNPADPISGRTLTLSLGTQSCSAATDANGIATCAVTASGSLGPQPAGAGFAGDGYFLPAASRGGTATVFAFPSAGAFTVGDGSLAAGSSGTVTWWGSHWTKGNPLTAGPAPAAFKGFTGSVPDLAAACSGTWTSTGGNSASPPGSVPSYMGVLVTSGVRRSGGTLSGQFDGIAIVRVNPGYGPNPGHPGTGTVVAMYCGG